MGRNSRLCPLLSADQLASGAQLLQGSRCRRSSDPAPRRPSQSSERLPLGTNPTAIGCQRCAAPRPPRGAVRLRPPRCNAPRLRSGEAAPRPARRRCAPGQAPSRWPQAAGSSAACERPGLPRSPSQAANGPRPVLPLPLPRSPAHTPAAGRPQRQSGGGGGRGLSAAPRRGAAVAEGGEAEEEEEEEGCAGPEGRGSPPAAQDESHRVLREDAGGRALRGRQHESFQPHPASGDPVQEGDRQGEGRGERRPRSIWRFPERGGERGGKSGLPRSGRRLRGPGPDGGGPNLPELCSERPQGARGGGGGGPSAGLSAAGGERGSGAAPRGRLAGLGPLFAGARRRGGRPRERRCRGARREVRPGPSRPGRVGARGPAVPWGGWRGRGREPLEIQPQASRPSRPGGEAVRGEPATGTPPGRAPRPRSGRGSGGLRGGPAASARLRRCAGTPGAGGGWGCGSLEPGLRRGRTRTLPVPASLSPMLKSRLWVCSGYTLGFPATDLLDLSELLFCVSPFFFFYFLLVAAKFLVSRWLGHYRSRSLETEVPSLPSPRFVEALCSAFLSHSDGPYSPRSGSFMLANADLKALKLQLRCESSEGRSGGL